MSPKSKYNPRKRRRNSLRLKGYDYSQPGFYFVTICCQDRMPCFGYIIHGKMHLSDAGKMIEKWYYELENKFPHIKCHAMVVMPDHFHCMIEITPQGQTSVSAPVSPTATRYVTATRAENATKGEHRGSPLWATIQWFKTMTTNEYIRGVKNLNWMPFNKKLWQRSYHDIIVPDDRAFQTISRYIHQNPVQWKGDAPPPKEKKAL